MGQKSPPNYLNDEKNDCIWKNKGFIDPMQSYTSERDVYYKKIYIPFQIYINYLKKDDNFYTKFLIYYTSPRLLNMYNHIVSENALKSVVSITTLEVKTPSCPIFFAIT